MTSQRAIASLIQLVTGTTLFFIGLLSIPHIYMNKSGIIPIMASELEHVNFHTILY